MLFEVSVYEPNVDPGGHVFDLIVEAETPETAGAEVIKQARLRYPDSDIWAVWKCNEVRT